MTSNSSRRRSDVVSAVLLAAFFTAAGYTTIGCGSSYRVPSQSYPKPPKNSATVNITVKDFATGEPIEGATVTMFQGKVAITLQTGIGGSAYFYDGFRDGAVDIEVTANGYERVRTSNALLPGYNKDEVRLKRR